MDQWMSALVTWLRDGMARNNNGKAISTPINDSTKDSLMNCLIKSFLPAPTTLRTPTSLALLDARAVDRFMKLIQAITCIITAINNKIFKNDGLTVLLISTS